MNSLFRTTTTTTSKGWGSFSNLFNLKQQQQQQNQSYISQFKSNYNNSNNNNNNNNNGGVIGYGQTNLSSSNFSKYYSTSTTSSVIDSKLSNLVKEPIKQQQTQQYTQSPYTPLTKPHPKLAQLLEQLTPSTDNNNNNNSSFIPHISTLPNGIKVITTQTNDVACAIGLYIKAGPKYETIDVNRGVFHLLEKMFFKTTKNQSTSEIVKRFENISLNATSSSSKDVFHVSTETLKSDFEYIVRTFSEQILCPEFKQEEFELEKQNCINSFEMFMASADSLTSEVFMNLAFGDQGLGHPLVAAPEEYEKITIDQLRETIGKQYVGNNIVISVSGIDHQYALDIISKYFKDIPSSSPSSSSSFEQQQQQQDYLTNYIGGTRFLDAPDDFEPIYQFGFPAPGLGTMGSTTKSKDLYCALLLQTILGSGSEFSTGGPGKGMQSRLNLHVVYRMPEIKSCGAFFSFYTDTSMFGVKLCTQPGYLNNSIALAIEQVVKLPKLLTDIELQRAKSQQIATVKMNLEMRGVMCDDMGRQLITSNQHHTSATIAKGIESVSRDDLIEFLQRILKNKPTVVGLLGKYDKVPTADHIHNYIKQQVK